MQRRRGRGSSPWIGPWIGLAVLCAGGCREDEPACAREPAGHVTVFVEGSGDERGWSATATVLEAGSPSDIGLRRYRLRASDGTERVLVFGAPHDSLPVGAGETYEFVVETVPGTPTPCALVVRKAGELLFAAVSDYEPGRRVLVHGLDGFAFALERTPCGSRDVDPCFRSKLNAILRVEHAGATVRLLHGESANLGDFQIACLTAQFVETSDRCADAVAFGVSYTVRRAR